MAGPTQKEIDKKVDELQTALDTEQKQVADLLAEKNSTIETLNTTITELQGQLADGGTAAERQATFDKLVALKDDLVKTVPPAGESLPDDGNGGIAGGTF